MKYIVLAIAMNRKTRKLILCKGKKRFRTEIIDTKTNTLFKNLKTPKAIEKIYESFWNDLNPSSKEIVKVISVTKK